MPPLPTLWDPAGAVDKLPQPFRMIDKILAEVVEQVWIFARMSRHAKACSKAWVGQRGRSYAWVAAVADGPSHACRWPS
jgi:hypothetical protein